MNKLFLSLIFSIAMLESFSQEMPELITRTMRHQLKKSDFAPRKSARADVAFSHVNPVNPALNRFFYMTVGAQWFWIDKRGWTRRSGDVRMPGPRARAGM